MDLEALDPYQVVGADWLSRMPQALLADEMGLGKTAQAIVASDLVSARRICVVCPAAARVNWRREFARFSFMDRSLQILESRAPIVADVVVCSFDFAADPHNLRSLIEHRFDVLVIDECHYLKAKDATRTRAIYKFLAPAALRVWRLSGTPSPNGRPDELWPHLASAGVTTLDLPDFVARYCAGYESPYGFRITGPKPFALPELRALIAKMTLRRTIAEVAPELPPIRHETVHVEAAPVDEEMWFTEQIMASRGIEHFRANLKAANDQLLDLWKAVDSNDKRIGVLDTLSTFTSMGMLRRYVGLSKVPAVAEILRGNLEHDKGYKVCVFAAHRNVIEFLRQGLKDFGAVMFFGGMSDAKRQKHVRLFADDPACRVIIGHIQAMGTAVDGLQTSCREVAIIEPSWVPGENAQAAMRVHRRGVSGPVRVRWFAVDGSIDEQIIDALRRKTNDQTKLIG